MNVVADAQHAMTNGHCSLQLGVWGCFNPPAGPGQSSAGGPGGGARGSSRDPIVYIGQKYTPVGH